MYLFNITLSQRHNFSNKYTHFFPAHLLLVFHQNYWSVHFSQCSGSGRVRMPAVTHIWHMCLCHMCTEKFCTPPTNLVESWPRHEDSLWQRPFGTEMVDSFSACVTATLLSPLLFELMDRVFSYSPLCLQLQSLVLNSFQPSLKQGQCFVAAVLL